MVDEQNAKFPQSLSQDQVDRLMPEESPHSVASYDQSNEELAPYPLAAPAQIWPRVFPGL